MLTPFTINAADPFTVRTIYFQPTDAPPAPNNLQQLMTDVQQFYANQMEQHGYGHKTLTLETDGNANPIIHTINGKHPSFNYLTNTAEAINTELPFDFTWNNPASRDRIRIIIVGGLDRVNTSRIGFGGANYGW